MSASDFFEAVGAIIIAIAYILLVRFVLGSPSDEKPRDPKE